MREKPFRGLIRIFFHGIFGPAEQLADKTKATTRVREPKWQGLKPTLILRHF
jgi:hypothetical protein